jgi:hypothetical protein
VRVLNRTTRAPTQGLIDETDNAAETLESDHATFVDLLDEQ